MEAPRKIRPHSPNKARAYKKTKHGNYNKNAYKRVFNRTLLPTPAQYYCNLFPGLNQSSEWTKVRCCFHKPDNNPSLNINLVEGHFRCFACGIKGHDIIAFHQHKNKVDFQQAVTDLGAWSHEQFKS